MMDLIKNYILNLWQIMMDLAPWLLFGLVLAGLLHVLLPEGFIKKHLGKSRWGNVLKAVLIGVPMPLCSCGVIPATLGLKKEGASDGAAVGFLISTPQTGVDSILVSAAFLGWPLALFKVLSALVSGLVGGILTNVIGNSKDGDGVEREHKEGSCCAHEEVKNCCAKEQAVEARPKFKEALGFSFGQLLGDIYLWLILGVLAAALITTAVPPGALAEAGWARGVTGMLLMLALSLPMYVCATASVPLAGALVAIGMSPGAALVFLMAGPTTNVATLGTTYRTFGGRIMLIYVATVVGISLIAGLVFDGLLGTVGEHGTMAHHEGMLMTVAGQIGAVVLTVLILGHGVKRLLKRTNSH